MIKAVLFDLDNTLIDFMVMKRRCTEAAVSAMIDAGLGMSKKKAYTLMFELYERHGIEDSTIYQKFLQKYVHKVDYKILSAGVVAYRKVRAAQLVPYPQVRATLIALKSKGLKLGVVSDAPKMQAWLRLTEMSLVEFFDVVLGFEDTGELKPSSAPFKKALLRMKVKASEVVFIGDNPHRDIVGAKKVGMKTVLAKYGGCKSKSGADWEIKGIGELLKIVK
ncbi:MAG: HAD-IA family hydrolase [Nanoarchaeota archaeon]